VADLAKIRDGLEANLLAIENLQVAKYVITNPVYPTALVLAGPTEFDKAFGRGLDMLVFLVRVVVAAVTDIGPGVNLDAYLAGSGPRSIKAAIESEKTLGGACADLRVTGHEGERVYLFDGGSAALGSEWRVEVNGRGTS
jgi:hypothetical protein